MRVSGNSHLVCKYPHFGNGRANFSVARVSHLFERVPMNLGRQFTVLLENKPGRLLAICSALAKEKVNIQAMTVTDSKDNSVLRFVPDMVEETKEVLQKLGVPFTETEVFLVEVKHQAGAIANLCEQLASERVNIDYIYCSAGTTNRSEEHTSELQSRQNRVR